MILLLLFLSLFPFDSRALNALAFVESSNNACAQRGQYRGLFQQGTIFSRDLGHPNSEHVLCNRRRAVRDFWKYQRLYGKLTQKRHINMVILHASGPGALKSGRIPVAYFKKYFIAYLKELA